MKKLLFRFFILTAELIAIIDALILSFLANRLLESYFFAIFMDISPKIIIGGLLWLGTFLHRDYDKHDKLFSIFIMLINVIFLCLFLFGPLQAASLNMVCLLTGYSLFAVLTPSKKQFQH